MDSQSDKWKLVDSDTEEDNYDYFKDRPQFQGPHGQELYELSSRLPDRLKLDERFAEVFEPENIQDTQAETTEGINKEREKNIEILESVLGHQICPTVDKNKSKKRQIRFDPDDENASHLVKNPEIPSEKLKKSKKKKKAVEEKVEEIVPVSTERYIEVCPNLKEILNATTPFSFSQRFGHVVKDSQNESSYESEKYSQPVEEIEIPSFKKKDVNESQMLSEELRAKQIVPKSKGYGFLFFVNEGDPRLKEGIQFFKRPKPLDEIRIEWQKRREHVLELFRRKKRSTQRSRSTRVQSMQNKFAVRKQHFKK